MICEFGFAYLMLLEIDFRFYKILSIFFRNNFGNIPNLKLNYENKYG